MDFYRGLLSRLRPSSSSDLLMLFLESSQVNLSRLVLCAKHDMTMWLSSGSELGMYAVERRSARVTYKLYDPSRLVHQPWPRAHSLCLNQILQPTVLFRFGCTSFLHTTRLLASMQWALNPIPTLLQGVI